MKPLDDLTLAELAELISSGNTSALVTMILDHKTKWNELMKENRKLKQELMIKDLDLKGKTLNGIDFGGTSLTNANFSGAKLEDVDLSGSDIDDGDFSDSSLTRVNLTASSIERTNMYKTQLYETSLQQTYLTGSVNLFMAEYRTAAVVTEIGFRLAESIEYGKGSGDDDEKGYDY